MKKGASGPLDQSVSMPRQRRLSATNRRSPSAFDHQEQCRIAALGLEGLDPPGDIGRRVHRLVLHFEDDVARLDPRSAAREFGSTWVTITPRASSRRR